YCPGAPGVVSPPLVQSPPWPQLYKIFGLGALLAQIHELAPIYFKRRQFPGNYAPISPSTFTPEINEIYIYIHYNAGSIVPSISCDSGVPITSQSCDSCVPITSQSCNSGVPIPSISCGSGVPITSQSCNSGVPIPSISCGSGAPIPSQS
ncbi:unnamed protein product, partial [Staurois parvus]